MSWKASAWAKQQRLGSPAAKSILMCLADYADPTGLINGWASQAQLAEDAEVSERSVREWMQRLEETGLMTRRRQSRANGARAVDIIQLNLCVVRTAPEAAEGIADEVLPAESAGRANRQLDANLPADGDMPTGTEFRAHKEIPPISSQSPPVERERAREEIQKPESEEGDLEDPKRVEARGWALLKDWPGFAGMPKDAAMRAWKALSAAERAEAERKFKPWLALLKAQRKSHVPAPSTYFGQKLFEEVPEPSEAAAVPRFEPPFGPAFAVAVWRELVSGPKAVSPPLKAWEEEMVRSGKIDRERLERDYRARYGWPAVNRLLELGARRATDIEAGSLDHLKHLVEAVPVHTEIWEAWKLEHELRGWPWAEAFGYGRVMYFPRGGPAGLKAFEAGLAEAGRTGKAASDEHGDRPQAAE